MSERGGGILRNPYVWAFFIGVVVITGLRPLMRRVPDPPPVLAALPAWELVDQNGDPYGSDDLAGSVYVANFFFTRCVAICPALMQSTKRLQTRYEQAGIDAIRLVSISVDPESDTPERMSEYGARLGIDFGRWSLLTGEPEAIRVLLTDGFKVGVGERQELEAGLYDIAHSGKLVLVDGEGRIRGYYGIDEQGIDETFHRSTHVLLEQREQDPR